MHGRWIDANQPADVIREDIAQMLAESKEPIAEEWAIHDYECFGDLGLSEYTGIDQVAEAAHQITEHGPVRSHSRPVSPLVSSAVVTRNARSGGFT